MFVGESHNRALLGAAGHPVIRTPTLDGLAARGTLFRNSYCTSPICVPARASLATGFYPHQNRYWENSIALDGRTPTWMKRARAAGVHVAGIGKFHFRNGEDDNGFSEEIAAMHIAEGEGELIGLLRGLGEEPVRGGLWDLYTRRTGVGDETSYQAYDRRITGHTIDWLRARAGRTGDRPWALCVHYVSAHAPYTVPQELFDLYPLDRVPMPVQFRIDERPAHPAIQHLRRILGQPDGIDETLLRTLAACYFATITHLDREIGRVLAALGEAGLSDDTRVVYTADHGYSHGNHFILGLFNLYEHSVGVPLVMAGPDIPAGRQVEQIVSHVDLFPTLLEGLGVPSEAADAGMPGISLWRAMAGRESARVGFAEYHALGSPAGAFMLREGSDKLIYHVGMAPQLFDLAADPEERHDLSAEGRGHDRASALERRLREIVDPEAADRQAKADQRARVAELGGPAEILRRRGGFVYSPPPGEDWRTV
jgi:choline-sulfatase